TRIEPSGSSPATSASGPNRCGFGPRSTVGKEACSGDGTGAPARMGAALAAERRAAPLSRPPADFAGSRRGALDVWTEADRGRGPANALGSGRGTGGAPGAAGPGDVVLDERRSAQPVLVRSDQQRREEPVVLVEHAPVVSGVLVITDAARDARRRYEITRAVMTLLGLPAHRVYVMPRQP